MNNITQKRHKNPNGYGSLYYEKTRKIWRATVTLPNGKRKDFTSKNKQIAIKKRNDYIFSNHEDSTPICAVTLPECCEKYLEIFFARKKFNENTYRTHLDTLKRIKKFSIAELPIDSITVDDIIEYIAFDNERGYCKTTVSKDMLMIKWGFQYALEKGYTTNNPTTSMFLKDYLKNSKEDRKLPALTSEQQARFFLALEEAMYIYQPYSYMWLLAIFTGMRVGEICALKWENIDLDKRIISVKKTITRDFLSIPLLGETTKTKHSLRNIEYPDIVDSLLHKLLKLKTDSSEFVFEDSFHNFIYPALVSSKLQAFNKEYNIAPRLCMHMFRHTYATRMIEDNIPPQAVQHMLGHSRVDITLDTYTDFFDSQRKKYTEKLNNYWNNTISQNLKEELKK